MRPLPTHVYPLLAAAALANLGMDCRPTRPPAPPHAEAPLPPVQPAFPADGPGCGDGTVQGNEACDDGNLTPGDGCTSCAVDAPACGAQDGSVVTWTCAGSPSQCQPATCRSTGDRIDCPAELATRALTVTIRRTGYLDPPHLGPAHVRGGGLDCSCRETAQGRVCDGCAARVATCAALALASGDAGLPPGRWSGACTGAGPCALRPLADVAATLSIEADPLPVRGMVQFGPSVRSATVAAADGPGGAVLVTGFAQDGVIGARRLGPGQRSFVALATPDGKVGTVIDLGDLDRVQAVTARFGLQGDFWLVTSEGQQQSAFYASPAVHPHNVLWHFDAGGAILSRFGTWEPGHVVVMARAPDGSVVLAMNSLFHAEYGGNAWHENGLEVLAVGIDGRLRWRQSAHLNASQQDQLLRTGGFEVHPVAIRADAERIVIAGSYQPYDYAPGGLLAGLGTGSEQRIFTLELDRAGQRQSAALRAPQGPIEPASLLPADAPPRVRVELDADGGIYPAGQDEDGIPVLAGVPRGPLDLGRFHVVGNGADYLIAWLAPPGAPLTRACASGSCRGP
ncbi:MAG TPA: DUF4215 domain-containing protein [Kofleriaceae bacterium]|nr:DUF4215 domain-containing protein [Kofleriaceae bacterium]